MSKNIEKINILRNIIYSYKGEENLSNLIINYCNEIQRGSLYNLRDNLLIKYNNNWDIISSEKKLSLNFIREFKDYVEWFNISKNQKLNEEFIRELKYYVHWECISEYQNLSEE